MQDDVQAYIYEHIPIVEKNGFAIEADGTPYVAVKARLQDHYNHQHTAFGGSLSTSLILCAWASVRALLRSRGIEDGIIVIQSQTVSYDKPVTENFTARVSPLPSHQVDRFFSMLEKFGKSRLRMEAGITQENDESRRAKFTGEFVVLRK